MLVSLVALTRSLVINTTQIQPASIRDIQAIQHIAQSAWPETYTGIISSEQIEYMLQKIYSCQSLEQQMLGLSHRFIVLKTNKVAVGFASYSPEASFQDMLRLHKLYLMPTHKGKGYGQLLLKHIIEKALQNGFKLIRLNVNRKNPAIGFYQKLGFQIACSQDVPIGPYLMNDYMMLKKL
jgi:diamine N-acetyltransferase